MMHLMTTNGSLPLRKYHDANHANNDQHDNDDDDEYLNRDAGNTAFAQGCGTGDAQASYSHQNAMIFIKMRIDHHYSQCDIIQSTRHSRATMRPCLLLQQILGMGRYILL